MVGHETRQEELERENEELRRRIAALEERVAALEPLSVYRALFDDLHIPIVLFGSDGGVIDLNRVSQERIGVTRAIAVGRYNILQDPAAQAKGLTASFQQAREGVRTTLPPAAYDPSRSTIKGLKEQQLYTQITYTPFSGPAGEVFVAQVSQDITAQVHAQQAAREREGLLRTILDNSSVIVVAKDREGHIVLASRRAWEAAGMSWEELRGKTDFDLFPKEVAGRYRRADLHVLETLQPLSFEEELPGPGGAHVHLHTVKFPLFDLDGNVSGTCGVSTDVTEHRLAEAANRKLSEEMLRVKEAALRALSTPIIPIARGALVIPLIGDLDQERASQMVEVLLRGVAEGRAKVAILDLTGVTSAGPDVAASLLRVARAVGLLGAQVVLTGMQPRMAQTLASAGDELRGIVTRGTLESGIAYAMSALTG